MSFPHHIVSREEWGARPSRPRTPQGSALQAFLHHTENDDASRIVQDKQRFAAARAIQNFHMDVRGWRDFAYHFLVFEPGGNRDHALVLAGRPIGIEPAAQLGHNPRTLAIAIYGNGDFKPMARNTRFTVELLIRHFGPDVREIGGHRDVTPTDCPGKHFYDDLAGISSAMKLPRVKPQR